MIAGCVKVEIARILAMDVVVVPNLGNRLQYDSSNKYAKVGAHDVHEAKHRRVLSVVDHDVGVFEYEKSLHEYEQKRANDLDGGEDECELAFGRESRVMVHKVRLEKLNQRQRAID